LDRGSKPLQRKTPMPRGGPTERDARIPLQRAPKDPTEPRKKTPQAERLAEQEARLNRSKRVVKKRAKGRCERATCGRTVPAGAHTHHRKPRAMGGTSDPAIHSPANLLHLCPDCHAWIESNRDAALTSGLLVPNASDPALVPVETIHGRVLLRDDGKFEQAA
jgi:5-methylcytosine-specific restriction protein A